MTEPEQKFAAAAIGVFKRYGVRKATMEEIAAEAGVSKPTLYATFKNKDAALGGAIRYAKGASLKSVTDAWAGEDLADQIQIFLDRLVLAGFDMLHGAPDADAFENAVGQFSQAAIDATREEEIEAIASIISSSVRLEALGTSPSDYAKFVVESAMNAKRLAQSRGELEEYLRSLKATVLATLAPPPAS